MVGVDRQVDEADRIQRLEAQLHVLSGALRTFAEATTDYEHLLNVVARALGGTDGCVVRLLSDGGWLSPVAIHLPLEPHIRDADALHCRQSQQAGLGLFSRRGAEDRGLCVAG
jgi:hypothetical protein